MLPRVRSGSVFLIRTAKRSAAKARNGTGGRKKRGKKGKKDGVAIFIARQDGGRRGREKIRDRRFSRFLRGRSIFHER